MKMIKQPLFSARTVATSLSATALSIGMSAAHAGSANVYQVRVPEPSALSLMAGGLAAAVLLARVKRNKKK